MGLELIEKSSLTKEPDCEMHFKFTSCPADENDGMRIGYFLEGLFGPESDVPLTPTLKGIFEETSRNFFFIAEVNDKIIAACWYLTHAKSSEISVLGEVYTRPDYRRKGISKKLCQHALNHFIDHGGKAMLLGSNNPAAIKMYSDIGFAPYPEGLMRHTVDPVEDFDREYFNPNQNTHIREVQHGDIPGIANLIGAPNDWISVCYPIGLFSFSYQRQARCVSLYTMLKKAVDLGGCWSALVTDDRERLVGIGTLLYQGNRADPKSALIDIFVHPNFNPKAADLLTDLIKRSKDKGINELKAEILDAENQKIETLLANGFKQSEKLHRRETIGDKTYEIVAYLRKIN